jgi:hypothetical protein
MKHIKEFQDFIYESTKNDTLYEASFSGRAWSGKIKNVDDLLSWMYDKEILNKTEQAEKDRKFREYYRWYNDGDYPRGMNGMSDAKVEEYLEKSVEEFIKKVLAKYAGKYDRKDFRVDTLLGDFFTLKSIVDRNDAHGLLNYLGKKINTRDSEFESLLTELGPVYNKAKDAVNKAVAGSDFYKDKSSWDIPGPNLEISAQKRKMEGDGQWTPALEKEFEKMADIMKKMSDILSNVIEATQKLKQEVGV